MDYASVHVINSPPQDTSARKVSFVDVEHCRHSSYDQQLNDGIMVTKATNGQTFVIGVLPHRDDTQDFDMEAKSDRHVIGDSGKTDGIVVGEETKIKLNFSVDRLLGVECGRATQTQRTVISTNNNGGGSGLNHGQYECCKYLCNGQHIHLDSYHVQKQSRETGVLLSPSMDIKSVVRPTPIRALGNGLDDVLSYSSMASSIHKFHHQQHHHHHHHHHPQQQQQQPPPPPPTTASIAALSSLMAPFNGLKSLQINQQHFRQQANIQSAAAKSLDIPPATQQQPTNGGGGTNLSAGGGVGVGTSVAPSNVIGQSGKRKRSWSRAVFSNLQRKGLEIQFQQQKYITKPDRRKLAARLNLTDAQVKVWFQNRRMKWRHTRENLKSGQEKPVPSQNTSSTITPTGSDDRSPDKKCYTSSSDSDDDEIDVVE